MAEGFRHAIISKDDHGAILAMSAWFLACALVLCIAMRIGMLISTRHLPNVDDFLLLVAGVSSFSLYGLKRWTYFAENKGYTFAIGGTVAISLAVEFGLGKRNTLLNSIMIDRFQISLYVSNILYVLTVGVSKLSAISFVSRLTCTPANKQAVFLLAGLVVCWTIAITTSIVFECKLPRPWEVLTGKCIPMFSFWLSASIVDIISDLILVILPPCIVSGLQLPRRKKAVVIFVFALRLSLIALSIARLVYLPVILHTQDPSFYSIPYFILIQAHAAFSVMIACSPALKPFMDNVRTGMLSISLAQHCPNTYYGQVSYNMQTVIKASSTAPSNIRSHASGRPSDDPGNLYGAPHHAAPSSQFDRMPKIDPHLVARPVLPPAPSSEVIERRSRSVKRCPEALPTSVSRSRTRTPPRPPPPPEELRPDMSLFRGRAGSSCVGGSGVDASRPHFPSGDRGSEESTGSRMGIITKTQQWDVRYDAYHGV